MEKILIKLTLILCIIGCIFGISVSAQSSVYDDCADFSRVVQMSEGLTLDVVTEDNKYAFDGDDTHLIRVTSDAEWLVYEVSENGYFVFNTSYSPNEAISHFTFEYSDDMENWQGFNPITTVDTVDAGKWITVHYSLKKLPESAKYIRVTFGNVGGTAWSPCIESIECVSYNSNEIGFVDCVDTKFYNATAKLKNLGLISGYSDTEFKPGDMITRAEFASMMTKLLGLNNTYSSNALNSPFSDIDSDYWGASAIYALYGLGVVDGDENGMFNPDENISCQDALKIMVSSLGYTAVAENSGGYPTGYIMLASRLKLTNGLDLAYDEYMTRGDAALIMDNALDAEIVEQTTFGSENNVYEYDGNNILAKYHEIYEVSGEITDVGYASVFTVENGSEGVFVLDGSSYKIGEFDIMPYLGMNVTAYVQKDKNDVYTALYIEASDDTVVREFGKNEYSRIDGNYLYYTDDSGRERSVSLSANTKVIYNYKYKTRIGLISALDLESGYIRVISNGGGAADYVLVFDFDTYVISSGATLGGVFSDRKSGSVKLGLDDADDVMLECDGETVLYSSDYTLNQNDVVCAAISDDGKIADIRISLDTAYGSVTQVSSSDDECVIGGTTYTFSDYFKSSSWTVEPTDSDVTAYLDINGNIAYITGGGLKESYGYLRAVSNRTDTFGSEAYLQIVSSTGTAVEYTATTKTEINGVSKSLDDIFSLSPQLVKFTLKGDGTLASIETANELFGGINTDEFTLNYSSESAKFYSGLNVFSSKYQLDSETQVYMVPDDNDISSYEVGDLNMLISDTAYNVRIYDLGEDYRAAAVVVMKTADSDTVYNTDPICVVIDAGTGISSDGDKCLILNVYDGSEIRELIFGSDGAVDRTNGWVPNYTERKTSNGQNEFSAGEVIQYNESGGKCIAFRMLLTKDMIESGELCENNLADYGSLSAENYYSELYTAYGLVDKKLSDKLMVLTNTDDEYVRTVPNPSYVYVYDRRSKKLMLGDITDIEQDANLFVKMSYGATGFVIAFRN